MATTRMLTLMLLIAALVACGHNGFTMTGSLLLLSGASSDTPCRGLGGYADITKGSIVTVYNPEGSVVAVGALGPGQSVGGTGCLFQLQVPDVPAAKLYQVEVAHRGRMTVTEADARTGRAAFTLG